MSVSKMQGIKVAHMSISDACRTIHGDEEAFQIIMDKLLHEFRILKKTWPIGKNVKFHLGLFLELELSTKRGN